MVGVGALAAGKFVVWLEGEAAAKRLACVLANLAMLSNPMVGPTLEDWHGSRGLPENSGHYCQPHPLEAFGSETCDVPLRDLYLPMPAHHKLMARPSDVEVAIWGF